MKQRNVARLVEKDVSEPELILLERQVKTKYRERSVASLVINCKNPEPRVPACFDHQRGLRKAMTPRRGKTEPRRIKVT